MFNLNSVYLSICFSPKRIDMLAVQYTNEETRFLDGISYANDNNGELFYNQFKIIDYKGLKSILNKMISKVQKKLGLLFKSVIVTLHGVMDDVYIDEIHTEMDYYKNSRILLNELFEKNKKILEHNREKDYYYSGIRLKEIVEENGKCHNTLNDIDIGTKIKTKWSVVYNSYAKVSPLLEIFSELNLSILSISNTYYNLYGLLKEQEINSSEMIVIVSEDFVDLVSVKNQNVIEYARVKQGTDCIKSKIRSKLKDTNIDVDAVINKLIRQSLFTYSIDQNINMICVTNDKFLSIGFLNNENIYGFAKSYAASLADLINAQIREYENKYNESYSRISFIYYEDYIMSVAKVVRDNIDTKIFSQLLALDLVVNKDIKFLLPLAAIKNCYLYQYWSQNFTYCALPYYSSDYEIIAKQKINKIKIGKNANMLIQKIVK